MHSIVVLGDVRVHEVHAEAPTRNEKPLRGKAVISGGAELMKSAIGCALESVDALVSPEILACENAMAFQDWEFQEKEHEYVLWKVRKTQRDQDDTGRLRLADQRSAGFVCLPKLTEQLAQRLIDNQFGGPNTKRGLVSPHAQGVPDVVVIDDLGMQFGKIPFPSYRVSSYGDSPIPKKLAARLKAASESGRPNDKDLYDSREQHGLRREREELMKDTLSALFSRLETAAEAVGDTGKEYPIEPVIVISAGGDIPDIRDSYDKTRSQPQTVWQHLYACEALRRRTVVLLDARKLRDDITISSGLSWERTAQDTIVEFKRSEKLRPLLRFGHIVIRYGITGALLISKDDNDDWTNTLYFNPDQDDVHWTPQDDGVVLGDTSVIVSTIVEHLCRRCTWRSGSAILADLRYALDKSLLLAVSRLRVHYALGYGTDADEYNRVMGYGTDAEEQNQETDEKGGMLPFHDRIFTSRAEVLKARPAGGGAGLGTDTRQRISVQRIKLLPFRSRYWSILGQSCQSDVNNVARDIVKHGGKVALNTLEDPIEDFVTLWVDNVVEERRKRDSSSSLFLRGSGETREELLEQIKKSLSASLEEGNKAIRRLIGDSFFHSVLQLSNDLAAGDDMDLMTAFDEVANTQRRCTTKFRGQVNRIKSILIKAGVEEDRHSRLQRLLRTLPAPDPDREIRRAYGALLRWVRADPSLRHTVRDDLLQLTNVIDDTALFSPRDHLHQSLTALIRRHEPMQGWAGPISTPVLRLGRLADPKIKPHAIDKRLMVIDRKEVESIRAVKRMIDQFLRSHSEGTPDRPLSIAVFGPPGAGKSLAVKKIMQMMDDTGVKTQEMTVNLSSLSGVDALDTKLHDVVQKIADGYVPIVFFDEFDSAMGGKKYGWLKFFLELMEDGEMIKSAVLVFAGGTCDTFEEFSLAEGSRSDPQWAEFSEKKGPDFVSRLRGHINVVGINPATPDDDLYLIRRALTLRFLLSEKQHLGDFEDAKIDDNMLNAFLHVPEYVHGARSMRMLIELCLNRDGNVVSMSEMPPIHQLNMQVDGKAFAALATGQTEPVITNRARRDA